MSSIILNGQVAHGTKPRQMAVDLQSLVNRTGCVVAVEFDKVTVIAGPSSTTETILEKYEAAKRRGGSGQLAVA